MVKAMFFRTFQLSFDLLRKQVGILINSPRRHRITPFLRLPIGYRLFAIGYCREAGLFLTLHIQSEPQTTVIQRKPIKQTPRPVGNGNISRNHTPRPRGRGYVSRKQTPRPAGRGGCFRNKGSPRGARGIANVSNTPIPVGEGYGYR